MGKWVRPTTTKCVHCKEPFAVGEEISLHYENDHPEMAPTVLYVDLAEMVRQSPKFQIVELGRGLALVELAS